MSCAGDRRHLAFPPAEQRPPSAESRRESALVDVALSSSPFGLMYALFQKTCVKAKEAKQGCLRRLAESVLWLHLMLRNLLGSSSFT